MFKPDDILEEKMREYSEQQTRNFNEALQKFQYLSPDDTYNEGDEAREKPFMEILVKLKDRQRSQNSEALVIDIAEKGLVVVADYLFGEEHVWKPGLLEKAVLAAAENDRPETTIFLLKHMEDWSGVFFQTVLEVVQNDETRRKLESFHNDYIENSRPDWIPEAGYNDAERLQSSDLQKVMKERRLWCIYQFLQKGQTPEKDDLLEMVKEGASREDSSKLIRLFKQYDQGTTVHIHRRDITAMLVDAYLKHRRENRSNTDESLKSLAHVFETHLKSGAKDKYELLLKGDIPGLMKAGQGRDPLAQVFDALPKNERTEMLRPLMEAAQENHDLYVLHWLDSTGLVKHIANPGVFKNLLACVDGLNPDDEDYQTQRRYREQINAMFQQLPAEELGAENGRLLQHVLDKEDRDLLSNLMERKIDWPRDLVEQNMRDAVYTGNGTVLKQLCRMQQDWQIDFIKTCTDMPSANKRNIESEVSSIKRSFMGEWSARNNSEISRSVSNDNSKISYLFNFKSAQMITTVTTYEGKGAAVEVTNFRDVQNSEEIDEAYKKLCIMHDDAPPYKGKDDTTRQHVIRRRNTHSR
ncbi:MAG: hypothetical protein EP349_05785 [Alphaproteobacteria bacterium]|nr:MAG: hypothetical protein EP349_05785 [Alphaproteobacteria bacterium]